MNKIFTCLLTTIILLPATNSFAQMDMDPAPGHKKLKIGAYVAPTMSWMRPTTSKTDDGQYAPENMGNRLGFIYGIMGAYNFAANYAFVTGIQVNMTGGKIYTKRVAGNTYDANVVNSADFDYHLSYLEIPAAIKLQTNAFSGFRFFGQAGLTLGINIAKNADYEVQYNDESGNNEQAKGDREKIKGALAIAPAMLQMNIGLGTEYAFTSRLSAYIGIFFNNGFLPDATNPKKYKMSYDLPFSDGNTRLNNLALRIGMFF